MINKKDENLITSIAYDATIGAGSAAEEPSAHHYMTLVKRLGRTAMEEDLKFFRDSWKRNLQMMAQP